MADKRSWQSHTGCLSPFSEHSGTLDPPSTISLLAKQKLGLEKEKAASSTLPLGCWTPGHGLMDKVRLCQGGEQGGQLSSSWGRFQHTAEDTGTQPARSLLSHPACNLNLTLGTIFTRLEFPPSTCKATIVLLRETVYTKSLRIMTAASYLRSVMNSVFRNKNNSPSYPFLLLSEAMYCLLREKNNLVFPSEPLYG